MRQLIIARKDLQMSPGKLAAQVSHASMAFLSNMIRSGTVDKKVSVGTEEVDTYHIQIEMQSDIYEDWLCDIFTKTICEAKNRNQLIKDNCLTELEPEEVGEDGIGITLTCIGFRPLPDEIAHQISRKYQLYR